MGVLVGTANDEANAPNDTVLPDSELPEDVAEAKGPEEEGSEEAVEIGVEISQVGEIVNNCSGLGA